MTENDTLAAAAGVFHRYDALKAQMEAVDAEIAELVKHYSHVKRLWGYTPLMLRREVQARMGREAG